MANVSHECMHGWLHPSDDRQQLLKLRQSHRFQEYAQTYGHIEKSKKTARLVEEKFDQ